jgi:hypothetical protein
MPKMLAFFTQNHANYAEKIITLVFAPIFGKIEKIEITT